MGSALLGALRFGFLGGLAVRMVTCTPGCSLYCPSVTTCSFASKPESMSACPSLICATLIGRIAAERRIDHVRVGTVRALLYDRGGNGQSLCRVSTRSRALTSWPGQSRCSLLGKFAFSWIEPVVCRIWLLTSLACLPLT